MSLTSIAILASPLWTNCLSNSSAHAAEPTVADRRASERTSGESAAPLRAWSGIVLHHSATGQGDVAALDAVHRKRVDSAGKPWLGVGYHFVIGNGQGMADGQVEPTFRWQRQLAGAHAGDAQVNAAGIGICLIGNFDEAPPTPRQVAATKTLVASLCAQYHIPRSRVLRHQDVRATQCPGRLFPLAEVLSVIPAEEAAPVR